jgi:hypothetical protein
MEAPEEIWRMAFSRRLGVVGIMGASWLVAVACNDESDKVEVVGAGGEAPSGGKSNAGGSSNNAGKGGNATAGSAGNGGMTSGGDAGAAGNGGTMSGAGNPGAGEAGAPAPVGGAGGAPAPVGGAGGAPEVVGGAAGAGGAAAGAGGEAGAPAAVAKSCANQCAIDDDCAIPLALGQKCNQTTHHCYDSAIVTCTTTNDCTPAASFWTVTCAADANCADDGSESCVDLDGVGYCALLTVGDACDLGGAPKDLPRHGAQGTSNVCVAPDTCQNGECKFSCADPLFGGNCPDSGDGNTCNPDTGRCECATGPECTSGVCGADSHCAACITAEDCAGGVSGQDICVAGKCGCSSAAVCADNTANGTPVCE